MPGSNGHFPWHAQRNVYILLLFIILWRKKQWCVLSIAEQIHLSLDSHANVCSSHMSWVLLFNSFGVVEKLTFGILMVFIWSESIILVTLNHYRCAGKGRSPWATVSPSRWYVLSMLTVSSPTHFLQNWQEPLYSNQKKLGMVIQTCKESSNIPYIVSSIHIHPAYRDRAYLQAIYLYHFVGQVTYMYPLHV